MTDLEIQLIEKKKRSLKRYKKTNALIERLEDKLAHLEDKTTSVRGIKFSDEPRGNGGLTNEDLILEKIELEERIERLKVKRKGLRAEILSEIDRLEDVRHVEVLEAFFIEDETLESIADMEGYSLRHVYRLYSEAITFLARNSQ